jgi:hypothetical protein
LGALAVVGHRCADHCHRSTLMGHNVNVVIL